MATATEKVPAIYGAILKVQEGIANIPKNGEMKFGGTNYKYLKADDVQDKLNPLLTENGIVVNAAYSVRDVEKGNRQWVYVDLELTYIATADGSQFPVVKSTGESVAGDDKSVNKALTQAIKNAHRATFQFASGEPEADDLPAQTGAPATRQSPAQAKVDKARATTPASAGAKGLQDKIKGFIAGDEAKRAQVNETQTALKAQGLSGEALLNGIISELGI